MASVPEVGFNPTLPVLLRRAVEQFADRDLLVMEDRRATFAEIERRSGNLARHLMSAGVGKGTRVGMHFPYCPEFLIAFLAVTRIGALAVPFSTTSAPGELRRGLRRNDVHTFLIPDRLLGRDELAYVEEAVPSLARCDTPRIRSAELPHLRNIWVLGPSSRAWATAIDTADEPRDVDVAMLEAAEDEVAPADWMVVISTSGSTAEPKGVVHTHGTVVRKTAMPLGPGFAQPHAAHAIFAAMPLFWIGGLITLTSALNNGTSMVCQERFEVNSALDLIERERCIGVAGWLSINQALREHPSVGQRDLSCIPMLTVPAAERHYGTVLGMTESCGPHLTQPHPVYGPTLPEHLRGSLGVASVYFDHKLVDAGGNTIDGDGEGELCLRGYATLAGMYKRERHEVFDDDGYYHTGDRVRLFDGLYYFTGRVTEMIKTHGANVAPPEVEQVLESHPEVKFAFVVGIPDEEREEQVAAVVVPADAAVGVIDLEAVRAFVRAELSAFKVPRTIVTMSEHEVPWLATGKPDKRTMREILIRAQSGRDG